MNYLSRFSGGHCGIPSETTRRKTSSPEAAHPGLARKVQLHPEGPRVNVRSLESCSNGSPPRSSLSPSAFWYTGTYMYLPALFIHSAQLLNLGRFVMVALLLA